MRDLKIIKIINDSEIFCKYCKSNQVSKRDVIAALNSNYYRVIENINRNDSYFKIDDNYNYNYLLLLFNENKKIKWSRVSVNLLKKFYVYITDLII